MYFAGDEYSDGQEGVRSLTRGSAICTKTDWVACPSCEVEHFVEGDSLIQHKVFNLTFAKKNFCEGATIEQGMVNFGALIFVVLGSILLNRYLHHMEVQFDEDEQTAQDYSIIINNPPSDATDPAEWREYFKVAFDAHVTGCTVAVDNDILVKTLVERRGKFLSSCDFRLCSLRQECLTLSYLPCRAPCRENANAGASRRTRYQVRHSNLGRYCSCKGTRALFSWRRPGPGGTWDSRDIFKDGCVDCQNPRFGATRLSGDKCVHYV